MFLVQLFSIRGKYSQEKYHYLEMAHQAVDFAFDLGHVGMISDENVNVQYASLNAKNQCLAFEFRKELREKFANKPVISGNEFHCYRLGKKAKVAYHWNHQSFMLVYNANVAKPMTGEEFYSRFQNDDRLQVGQEYSFAPNYYRVEAFLFGTLPD